MSHIERNIMAADQTIERSKSITPTQQTYNSLNHPPKETEQVPLDGPRPVSVHPRNDNRESYAAILSSRTAKSQQGPTVQHQRNRLSRGSNTMSSNINQQGGGTGGGNGGRGPTPHELADEFTRKHREAQASISRIEGLSNEHKNNMRRFLDLLKQEHDKQLQAHKDEYEQAFHECQQIKQQLNQSKQQIQDVNNQLSHVIQDRTKISVERDELLMRVNELTLRTRSSDEKLKDVEQRWAAKNAELMDKLEFQNQQLTGKRALWLSKNPESSARKDAMLGTIRSSQDPFNSPTANYTPGFEENRLTMMGSKSFTSPSSQLVPSTASSAPYPSNRGSKRRGGLPTGRAVPAPAPLDFQAGRASQRHITTEPGDDCTPSMALVLHNQENDVTAATFKALFHDLYYDFDLWVRKYTCKPSLQNDQAIPRSNQTLWQYILRMVSPYHTQDAHTHVVALLSDPRTRSWFVFRMLVSYCTINILNFEAFESFSPEVSKTLNECKEALKERGLLNERRQKITDRQVKAIQAVVSSPYYQEFRKRMIDDHTKSVRDMVGPLLNYDCERGPAGQELGRFVIKAWTLSMRMHTEHVTFQVHYPDTATKFVAATMLPKDTDIDAMQLQIQQTRVKLVLSPAVTMRDDRGTSITAKSILPAEVLVMG